MRSKSGEEASLPHFKAFREEDPLPERVVESDFGGGIDPKLRIESGQTRGQVEVSWHERNKLDRDCFCNIQIRCHFSGTTPGPVFHLILPAYDGSGVAFSVVPSNQNLPAVRRREEGVLVPTRRFAEGRWLEPIESAEVELVNRSIDE